MTGSNGTVFSVSYTGGDGNDIVLMVRPLPSLNRQRLRVGCLASSAFAGFSGVD